MSNTIAQDETALKVAAHAYSVARACREAQGKSDLPEWNHVPDIKKTYLSNAARCGLNGGTVWEVWAYSVGATPDDATSTLWREKEPALRLIPTVFHAVTQAVATMVTEGIEPGELPSSDPNQLNLFDDTTPLLEDEEGSAPEELEELGTDSEESSEETSTANDEEASLASS